MSPPEFTITTLAVLLSAGSLVLLVYWGVGIIRLIETWRRIPTLRAGALLARKQPPRGSVCIIVPAHNEEEAIGPLLESLKAQDYPDLKILLCLDRCTDRTREVAERVIGGDGRFRVVQISSCPEGWAGKVHAAWTGASQPEAKGAEYVLFCDADTVFDFECVSAAAALMEHRGVDLLSLLSTLTSSQWFERIVQPAAGLELVRQFPIVRANRTHRRRAFANGQFMLFRRRVYDAVGGHQAVRDELLEDIALARLVSKADRPAGLFLADGMLTCRMYDSWRAFRTGWKRIYTESTRCVIRRLRKAAIVSTVMGAVLPVAAAANLILSVVLMQREGMAVMALAGLTLSALGLLAWMLVVGATYRIGRVPLWTLPGFVIGSWLVGRILSEAARDLERGEPVVWGGRMYTRHPRRETRGKKAARACRSSAQKINGPDDGGEAPGPARCVR